MSFPGLTVIEDKLWCVVQRVENPSYDFPFESHFACRHPHYLESQVTAIARMGAAEDYAHRYLELQQAGIKLVHSPEQYQLTSELPCWYPLLQDLTPRSICFDSPPSVADIEELFDWPVFLKGERQTSRHQRRLSIIENPAQFESVMAEWRQDPILAWQRIACREFVPLRHVEADHSAYALPKSFEFRTFWWQGQCVGWGQYWTGVTYRPTPAEQAEMLSVAEKAARRLGVVFLVVDVAQTHEGEWIVIEVNDGQDSGYAAVNRHAMWQSIVDLI